MLEVLAASKSYHGIVAVRSVGFTASRHQEVEFDPSRAHIVEQLKLSEQSTKRPDAPGLDMRILLAIHNAYTDTESGAAHSMRILMQWLMEGGHDCRVLSSARFDAKPPDSLDAHLARLNVPLRRSPASKAFVRSVKKRPAHVPVGRATVDFEFKGVPATMLLTRARPGSLAEPLEMEQFLWLLDHILVEFAPDVLVTYGGHPVVQEAMRRARARETICVFSLRNFGYEDRRYFQHVDDVFTTSPYISDMYRQSIDLRSTGIDSPIDWSEVEAPEEMRRFVTFVNPSMAKGAMLFARLADMLGASRPDIPLLVVQSATGAGGLNTIPGLDFRKYPQIMAAPATPAASRLLRADQDSDRALGRSRIIGARVRRGADQRDSATRQRSWRAAANDARRRPDHPVASVDDGEDHGAADDRGNTTLVRRHLRAAGQRRRLSASLATRSGYC